VRGKDTQTLFWCDQWLKNMIFKSNISRLFDLANNKITAVVEIYSLEVGGGW